ncbi:MAG: alpha/beta hydrolase-fold protein [Eubacteriales bacterium]|nr:alpha/beta hydrolase-fold protein [Eubacteriales bacterium]
MDIGKYRIEIFCSGKEEKEPVIWLHTFPGEAEKIWNASKKNCTILAVTGIDWNRELSPWPAEKTFAKGENFAGGASEYLTYFTEEILPEAEQELPFIVSDRGIAGYSMAGLFAVFAMYRCDKFNKIGSISGSLWFDGWLDYVLSHKPKTEISMIYISLGSREHRVKEERMARVKESTEELIQYWKQEYNVIYEINPGGHFSDVTGRIARGIDHLSEVVC